MSIKLTDPLQTVPVLVSYVDPCLNRPASDLPPSKMSPSYLEMNIYVTQLTADIQVLHLLNSPYFQQLFTEDPAYLAGNKPVHIRLNAHPYRMDVKATEACLAYLCSMDTTRIYITPETLLSHFHAAFFFQLGGLVEDLAEKIEKLLSPQSIVAAVALAVETRTAGLMAAAYDWIRTYFLGQLGLIPPDFPPDPRLVLIPPRLSYQLPNLPPIEVSLDCYCNMGVDTLRKANFYHRAESKYTLMRVERTRNYDAFTGSDYPHTFKLIRDHDSVQMMYAERHSDSGDIVIGKTTSQAYSSDYIGVMENNFWGNEFNLYDDGIPEKHVSMFPTGFVRGRTPRGYIKFDSNILGEQPRMLKVKVEDEGETRVFQNLPPKWNERTECYTLNFYGRVSWPSAKNFELVSLDDPDTIYLLFGKVGRDTFNLDYRSPLTMFQAFCIALSALARKRIVS